jgi:glycine hydroxymethyltransferase
VVAGGGGVHLLGDREEVLGQVVAEDETSGTVTREALLCSLERQRRLLAASIVLTPVDSLPFSLTDRRDTAFLHGLYLTDKVRDRDAQMASLIQFPRRERAARDIGAIYQLLAERLGAAAGTMRLLSGLHAHTATFMSLGSAGQTILLLPEEAGGHFSTRDILERLGFQVVDLPVDYSRLCVDHSAALTMIDQVRPDFIFIDRSEGLRYEDFSFLGEVRGPTKVFDASHYVPQIMEGRYENPLTWGFDLMLFSMHKSLPGPQKAAIVSRQADSRWEQLLSGLSTLVSSSHAESTYLAGFTLLRRRWLSLYVRRMLETAAALQEELVNHGVSVIRPECQGLPSWPSTQHIWIAAGSQERAYQYFTNLAQARIHSNYRKLPYDLGYGLRLGTSFAAIAGIDASHACDVAEVIAAVLTDGFSLKLRHRVRSIAEAALSSAIVPPSSWA